MLSRLLETSCTQPCSRRVLIRERSTSAKTPTAPEISQALGCAPLMPPKPDEINNLPFKSPSCGIPNSLRPAVKIVLKVPCTIPCGPMYIQPPAVICP